MTKAEILYKVQRGELKIEEAAKLLEQGEGRRRAPPKFKVAMKSGWCSVYFDGLRRPCTLPASLWLELLEPATVEKFKAFLEHNKDHFKDR